MPETVFACGACGAEYASRAAAERCADDDERTD